MRNIKHMRDFHDVWQMLLLFSLPNNKMFSTSYKFNITELVKPKITSLVRVESFLQTAKAIMYDPKSKIQTLITCINFEYLLVIWSVQYIVWTKNVSLVVVGVSEFSKEGNLNERIRYMHHPRNESYLWRDNT